MFLEREKKREQQEKKNKGSIFTREKSGEKTRRNERDGRKHPWNGQQTSSFFSPISESAHTFAAKSSARARLLVPRGEKYAPLLSEIRKEEKKRRVILVHAPLKGPARCWGSPNGFQNPRGMSDMFWFSSRRSVNFEMRRCVLQKRALLFFL